MKRILLTVSYDGTAYNGWQIQPDGNTIEGQLNLHLSELFKEQIKVTGASRTDAGVHALGNLAVFDTDARMPAQKISYALNQRLPEDIRIQRSEEVPADFHPRRTGARKTYEYQIYNAAFPDPTRRLYSHFTYVPMDVELMRRGAAYLEGEHDFFSFSTYKPEIVSTVRTIYEIAVEAERAADAGAPAGNADADGSWMPQRITIRVTGDGFLYNMVRIIAGTLMEVGRGRIAPEQIPVILEARDRQQAGPTAPAHGLTLIGYWL